MAARTGKKSNNDDDHEAELSARLVRLFKEFGNAPNTIVEYMLANGAFKQAFVDRVMQARKLSDAEPAKSRYCADVDQLREHQDGLLAKTAAFEDMEGDVAEDPAARELRLAKMYYGQLRDAVAREDYVAASRLRDFIKFCNLQAPESFS